MANPAHPGAYKAARSIYLDYERERSVSFHNELTVEQSVPGSFFMVCGFEHGYFGLQELNDSRKLAIFSVWDDWQGDDRDPCAVPESLRAMNTFCGPGVNVFRFSREGTGGKSFFYFPWQCGQTYRFYVTSTIVGQNAEFAAHLRLPSEAIWRHLASFKRPTAGNPLLPQNSFVEDFRRDFQSARTTRRALLGNGWVQHVDGSWQELRTAHFNAAPESADEDPNAIDAGISGNSFYLQSGGQTRPSVPLGSELQRTASSQPTDLPAK